MNKEETKTQQTNYEATAHYYDAVLTTIRHYIISSMENELQNLATKQTLTLVETIIDESREHAKTEYNYE